nr:dipeptidase 1-like [Lytechinus pictus]
MNRLGMLIDLSHVSVKTMNDVLDIVTAPVMFSHTSAYELCNHYRNAPNSILIRVKENGGVVMVNFYTKYINCPPQNVTADDGYATLVQVADHMDHIKLICGWSALGLEVTMTVLALSLKDWKTSRSSLTWLQNSLIEGGQKKK